MIGDLIGIYRARRDPKTAARLAAKFAQGQVVERVTAPLMLPLVLLWVAIALCAVLVALSLWGSASLHGSLGLFGIIPAAIGYVAFRIQAGLRAGLDRVQALADRYAERGLDHVLPPDPSQVEPITPEP